MGPYARYWFNQAQDDISLGILRYEDFMGNFVTATFGEERFTRLFEFKTLPFDKRNAVRNAGDPLEHDIIVCFGNESNNHWYSVVVDNRPQARTVGYIS